MLRCPGSFAIAAEIDAGPVRGRERSKKEPSLATGQLTGATRGTPASLGTVAHRLPETAT